jgi:hypothetical protein
MYSEIFCLTAKGEIKGYAVGEIVRCAHGEMRSTHARRYFTARRAISYAAGVFHPPAGWISLKKALAEASTFFWHRSRKYGEQEKRTVPDSGGGEISRDGGERV